MKKRNTEINHMINTGKYARVFVITKQLSTEMLAARNGFKNSKFVDLD